MFVRLFITAFISFIALTTVAQKKSDYFIHKVRSGETYRSIAEKYNLSGRQLADYNNLEYYTGELTAKTLRIPRKSTIKKQDTAKNLKDTLAENTVQQTLPVSQETSQNSSTNPQHTQYTAPADTAVKVKANETVVETSVFRKNLPVLIYISASVILLIVAIIYYRFVNRN